MVGDSAFSSRPWLLKAYPDTTKNRKERYFNRKLRSARVVSEHAYGMLKGRFRFVYKKAECRRHNVKAVIMACINCTSHLCIVRPNPCLPRWQLMVERLNLIESDKSARNWLRKNTTVGDTIRLEDAFTGDYVKSLILIAPTTAIITSRRNVGTIESSYSNCSQHDNKIEHNRPDIIVEDKKEKSDAL